MLRDESGAVKPGLPKPRATDDATKAARAAEEWKLLKKQIATVARLQADRLERAMITGRRWSREEFERFFVRHPLMRHVVATLVWGACAADGSLAATFRLTEDLGYADSREAPFDLSSYVEVRIAHPLHMADEERAAWGEIFSDYEIVPPFAQLGRKVRRLEPGEADAREITRFRDEAAPPTALVGILGKTGWTPRPGRDGLCRAYSKTFAEAGAAAVIQFDPGLHLGWHYDEEPQRLTRCYFVPVPGSQEWDPEAALPLGRIDPVILSEVLGILGALASKGRS
jgi:hypothetical protein